MVVSFEAIPNENCYCMHIKHTETTDYLIRTRRFPSVELDKVAVARSEWRRDNYRIRQFSKEPVKAKKSDLHRVTTQGTAGVVIVYLAGNALYPSHAPVRLTRGEDVGLVMHNAR